MAKDNNILLDSPEEQISTGSLGTLLDAEAAPEKQESKLDTVFAQIEELYKNGDYEQVLAATQEAMKQDPSNGNLVLLMGLVNRDMGKKIQAVHWLRKAVNDFGMAEAELELMKLYQSGVAGADMKKKAEAYFTKQSDAVAVKPEVKEESVKVKEAPVKKVEAKTEAKAEPKQEAKVAPKAEAKPENILSKYYPAPGTPLYAVEEYRAFVDKHSNLSEEQRLKLAEEQGRGFGYYYMSCVQTAVYNNDRQIWRDWNNLNLFAGQAEISGPTAAETAKTLNSVNDFVRQEVAMKMQSYLKKRGEKVDCWPTSWTDSGFVADNIGDGTRVKLNFDYFAKDFGVTNQGDKRIISRGSERTFRNGYGATAKKVPKPRALEDLEREIYKLERTETYTSWDLFVSKVAMVVSGLLLLMIGIPAVLLVLAQMGMFGGFEGINEIVETFKIPGTGSNTVISVINLVLTLIPFLLWKIMMVISELAGMLNPGIGWFVTIVQALIVGVCSLVPLAFLMEKTGFVTKKTQREAIAARNRAVELANGEEIKRLREEYKKMCDIAKDIPRQAEQWHRAWFEACKRAELLSVIR